jgi:hypothetical protein
VRVLLLPLLLAACAADFVTVDRQPGLQGSWSLEHASLDVEGSTATLSFEGRLFVFERVDWLRGRITKEQVDLSGAGGLRIHVDKERIVIREGRAAADHPLASLPPGSRFAWQDGALKPR